ncbi:HTH-type transcriptional activator IlvY [Pasteurellaceae bacterium TAE3-ERU1]|uniref:HTH-type transcriptional activator IlvY n=1 Tax=Spirabiliibacterium mucosae TaxID=28156 RepID=UPI001AACEDDC|nr:HTH-type transcriptional activator IlvY [Spirabiliibacterium mucosae]MBE2898900.1 HTH-type transcriptional activator IlvY [Spirabiliibacterium mucosae]MBV7388161.1 HTH-type transcriptional activator IlvY [Pasteurellaceae bacterium TAE3-ERU1]
MEFQHLKLFLDLVQNQTFSQTAREHHMSASTLSRQIQRLERELGQTLLLRDNRRVLLTPHGEAFADFAREQWQRWQALKVRFAEHEGLAGELRLFCSVTASYSHLPPILTAFRTRYPNVDITLTTGDPACAIEQVRSNQADLAIVGRPIALPDNIAFHYIGDIQLSLIAPRVACLPTRLLQAQPVDWQAIPFILPVAGPVRERIDLWFRQMHIHQPQIYACVAGHEGIVPMVALGCGVALLPDVVINNSPMRDQVSFLTLPSHIAPFELGVCAQKKQLKHPLIAAFWAMLG